MIDLEKGQELVVEVETANEEVYLAHCLVLSTFPVLWVGWECDSVGYVVLHEDKKRLVLTSCGSPYFASVERLQGRIDYYKSVIIETESALNMVQND